MKHLLNTLYVLSEDSYLSLENQNAVIHAEDGSKKHIPLLGLEAIYSFSYKGASPALIGECVNRGIAFAMLTPNGRFLANAAGRSRGNVLLRKKQYRVSDSEHESLKIARSFIFGKLYNSKWCLERTIRDHTMRVDSDKIKDISLKLGDRLKQLADIDSMDSLRGIEGEAASMYFGVFDLLVLNQKDEFCFNARSRRPPLDRVNAMLSFGYSLLRNDCASALEGVGLDAYVGFMHVDRPGRESLALDIMEELRSVMVDRFVLTLINNRSIVAKNFDIMENGATFLNDKGRKVFIQAWQQRKREAIKHPYLEEKIQWGLVPHVQALLLARYLRGDMDAYPAFLWK